MSHTKLTRRIDGLGRIVIPKEIRDNLGVADGELLEINVMNNEIVLSKFSKLEDKLTVIKNIASVLALNFDCKVTITDRNNVIYSNNIDDYENKVISKTLKDYIINRVNFEIKEIEVFKGEFITDESSVMTIIKDSDALGVSIVSTNDIELSKKINKVITSLII